MIITSHGISSVKAQFGDTVLVFNPPSKSSKNGKPLRFQANISLISLNHPDMNGVDSLSDKKEAELFVINGPGEYEVGGVFIEGFRSTSNYGGKDLLNTIYKVSLEGMTLVHLGALSKNNLSNEVMEALNSADIIFTPIGGDGVFNVTEASKFSVKLSPSIIVPIHYDVGDKNSLKNFLKEEGEEDLKAIEKLTIKKSDLLNKEGEVVVIKNS